MNKKKASAGAAPASDDAVGGVRGGEASPGSRPALAIGVRGQQLLLLTGLILLVFGGGLVLYTTGALSLAWALIPSVLIAGGLLLFLGAFWRGWHRVWYSPATMLVLCGSALLLIAAAAPGASWSRLWPFLVVFAGVSIIPTGMGRRRRIKPGLFVLSSAFILMGCFFLLFSLKVVRMSLRGFLIQLWPLLLISVGAVLVALYLVNSIRFKGRG